MRPESPHLTASANSRDMSWSRSSSWAFSKTMSPALTWGRGEDLGSWGPLAGSSSSISVAIGAEVLVPERSDARFAAYLAALRITFCATFWAASRCISSGILRSRISCTLSVFV